MKHLKSIPDSIKIKNKLNEEVQMDKIDVKLYGGQGKLKSSADVIYCSAYNNCSLFKQGKCMQSRRIFKESDKCLFSYIKYIEGYTPRSQFYSDFNIFIRTDVKYNAIETNSFCFASIEDYYL